VHASSAQVTGVRVTSHGCRKRVCQNRRMPLLERVRTEQVVVGWFCHEPADPVTSVEWWEHACIAFTTFGSWEIRSRRGGGQVTPEVVLVTEGGAEHDCRHPHGVEDRMLCIVYRDEVDPGPAVLVPQKPAVHSLQRSLVAQLRLDEPDHDEVGALCLAIHDAVREDHCRTRPQSARSRALVDRLRVEAEARYLDPDLDLAESARAFGMSRTRFTHVFRDVVGVTPHRYVVELRSTHAAWLLRRTAAPVIDVCFDSGFGSMPRFHAAFRAAFGTSPSAYRALHRELHCGGALFV